MNALLSAGGIKQGALRSQSLFVRLFRLPQSPCLIVTPWRPHSRPAVRPWPCASPPPACTSPAPPISTPVRAWGLWSHGQGELGAVLWCGVVRCGAAAVARVSALPRPICRPSGRSPAGLAVPCLPSLHGRPCTAQTNQPAATCTLAPRPHPVRYTQAPPLSSVTCPTPRLCRPLSWTVPPCAWSPPTKSTG